MRRKWVIGAVATVSLLLAAPGTVLAHAVLLRVIPPANQTLRTAPDHVELLFSEPIDPSFSLVRIWTSDGQPADVGDSHVDPNNDQVLLASLQPNLPDGVYVVLWRNLSSIDVHPDDGEYRLYVGVPVQANAAPLQSSAQFTATPETTIGRWWFYLAASLFGGVLATWKFVTSGLLEGPYAVLRAAARRRTQRTIVVGGVLLILGTLFTAVAQAAAAANVPIPQAIGQPLADLVLKGRFASIWWPRLGLEVASLVLILFGGVEGLASECALATLPAVLLTSALTSHGAALPLGTVPGVAIDWLHIVGATAWVGGLLAIAALIPVVWKLEDSSALLRDLVARFARYALIAAGLVLLSGVLQASLELGSVGALTQSLYGELVLAKLVLLAAMLILASLNEWRARVTTQVALAQVRGFRRGVRLELVLGIVVFAVAAVLSGTPPTATGGP